VDVSVEVVAFFRWLEKQPAWKEKSMDIANMKRVIVEEKDLSLLQLYRMLADVWEMAGLKWGQKSRVNDSIRCYRRLKKEFEDAEVVDMTNE
jgi:hypothetical protein